MVDSEQILEFIDGSLDADVEQQLFNAMAHQPELRTALRQFIQIGEGVRSDREAFLPPAHVERDLFAGLGLAPIAGAVAPEVAAAGWLARLATLGSRFWPLMAAFFTGAVVAGGGTYLLTQQNINAQTTAAVSASTKVSGSAAPSQQQPVQAQPPVQEPSASADMNPGSPIVEHSESSGGRSLRNITSHTSHSRRTIRSQFPPTTTSVEASDETTLQSSSIAEPPVTTEEAQATVTRPAIAPASVMPPDVDAIMDSSAGTLRRQTPRQTVTLPSEDDKDRLPGQVVEFRKQIDHQQLVVNRARRAEESFQTFATEDFALGYYRRVGDLRLMLGLEGGIERYAQTLAVYRGDTTVVEQMPDYWWVGASGRYHFGTLPIIDVQPFVQFTGGFGRGGVLRGRFGGNYQLPTFLGLNTALSASYEASALIYSFNGQPQLAGRYGFTGGISILW
jgi:hypothetical protein